MSPLVKDLLIKGLMAGTAVRQAKRSSVGFGYYALAGGFGFLGIVFLAIAGYSLLQVSYAVPVAAAMTGSIILLIGIGIGMFGYYSLNKKKIIKKPVHDGSFIDMIEGTLKNLVDGFEEPIRDNPKAALLMAALAGFAAGDKMGGDGKIH